MKKRIEKQIENDLVSVMPTDHLSFEDISKKVEWEQYGKEKKSKLTLWQKILIPVGAVASFVFAVGLTATIVLLNTGYGAADPNHFAEGSYSLVSFESYFGADFSFSAGEKASVSHESVGGPGVFLLSQDDSGYDGCFVFEDGPLSTVTFTDVSFPSGGSISAFFSDHGESFAINIYFCSTSDPFFEVQLTSTSSNYSAKLFYD
jgi:hypothetical protein